MFFGICVIVCPPINFKKKNKKYTEKMTVRSKEQCIWRSVRHGHTALGGDDAAFHRFQKPHVLMLNAKTQIITLFNKTSYWKKYQKFGQPKNKH